ncbi:hypothetical protein BKA66DRAFT_93872 [Pyrenochaeta sp. MPI-SDFR-AT-0127]|nr:hypothetical protein BKA66DRAFT_93872 [Pyrenochaeta sp. MPI-SDFR-AT-0127]
MAVFPRAPTSTGSTSSPLPSSHTVSRVQSTGSKAGIVVGTLLCVGLLLVLVYISARRRFKDAKRNLYSLPNPILSDTTIETATPIGPARTQPINEGSTGQRSTEDKWTVEAPTTTNLSQTENKQLTPEQILGLDKQTLLQDLPTYEAEQSSSLTIVPARVENNGDVKFPTQGSETLGLCVNPRDVEKGPNPFIEAHIIQALRDQEENSQVFASHSQHCPIYELDASETSRAHELDTRPVPKTGISGSAKGKEPIVDGPSKYSHNPGEMEVYLPPPGDPGNFCWQGTQWHNNGGLEPGASQTYSETESKISTSTVRTPCSSSSTPPSSDALESCSCSMLSEGVEDSDGPYVVPAFDIAVVPTGSRTVVARGESGLNKQAMKSMLETPHIVLYPALAGPTGAMIPAHDNLPSVLDTEILCSTDAPLAPISTHSSEMTSTSTATTATADSNSTADLPYACPKCTRTFATPGLKRSHYNRKHNLRFLCKICGAAFGLRRDLQRHEHTVHKDRQNSQAGFRCTNIGCATPNKAFNRRDNFMRHVERCRQTITKGKGSASTSAPG